MLVADYCLRFYGRLNLLSWSPWRLVVPVAPAIATIYCFGRLRMLYIHVCVYVYVTYIHIYICMYIITGAQIIPTSTCL